MQSGELTPELYVIQQLAATLPAKVYRCSHICALSR